jgi:hypothetical protein
MKRWGAKSRWVWFRCTTRVTRAQARHCFIRRKRSHVLNPLHIPDRRGSARPQALSEDNQQLQQTLQSSQQDAATADAAVGELTVAVTAAAVEHLVAAAGDLPARARAALQVVRNQTAVPAALTCTPSAGSLQTSGVSMARAVAAVDALSTPANWAAAEDAADASVACARGAATTARTQAAVAVARHTAAVAAAARATEDLQTARSAEATREADSAALLERVAAAYGAWRGLQADAEKAAAAHRAATGEHAGALAAALQTAQQRNAAAVARCAAVRQRAADAGLAC